MLHVKRQIPERDIEIVLVSDWHIGNVGHRIDLREKVLRHIRKKDVYWIGCGDYVEGRPPSHKFYISRETEIDLDEQYHVFKKEMKPLMNKCLGMVIGNHEYGVFKETTLNPIEDFCFDNNVPFLGYEGMIDLYHHVPTERYRILVNHGAGGGVTHGAPVNKCVNYLKSFNADMFMVGHFHNLDHTISMRAANDEMDCPYWANTHIVMGGSLLCSRPNGAGGYAEFKMLPPNALGYSYVKFDKNLEPTVCQKAMDVKRN